MWAAAATARALHGQDIGRCFYCAEVAPAASLQTASATQIFSYFLVLHPDAAEELRAEILVVDGPYGWPSVDDMKGLNYHT